MKDKERRQSLELPFCYCDYSHEVFLTYFFFKRGKSVGAESEEKRQSLETAFLLL